MTQSNSKIPFLKRRESEKNMSQIEEYFKLPHNRLANQDVFLIYNPQRKYDQINQNQSSEKAKKLYMRLVVQYFMKILTYGLFCFPLNHHQSYDQIDQKLIKHWFSHRFYDNSWDVNV